MNTIALAALVKMTLPSRTLRFCDGGFIEYASETYRSGDSLYGTIGDVRVPAEKVGDTVPSIIMQLLPPDTTAPVEISEPGNQTSRVQFYIVEYDVETGVVTTGDTIFNGQLDQMVLSRSSNSLSMSISIVGLTERLFEQNIGNSMNPVWHKSVWPGELGHDNGTGLSKPIAWGVEAPGAATTMVSSGSTKKKKGKGQ